MKYPKPNIESGRVLCPICKKDYADKSGYRYHYKKHHAGSEDLVAKDKIYEEYGLTKKQLDKVLKAKAEKQVKPLKIEAGETYKFGAIGDTHLCSKEERLEALYTFYEMCKKEGVKDIYHAGDIMAGQGVYRGQEYEIHTFGADNQVDYVVKNYPKVDGITTHFILGNHDYIYYKQIGLDVGKMIAQDREDMNYLGVFQADVMVNNIPLIRLLHPDGGMAYAMSYRMQKYVEQISSNKKPRIILAGHQHTAMSFFYRNIYVVQVGAFEGQTMLILRKGINPVTGGYIITVKVSNDSKKSIVSFLPDHRVIEY